MVSNDMRHLVGYYKGNLIAVVMTQTHKRPVHEDKSTGKRESRGLSLRKGRHLKTMQFIAYYGHQAIANPVKKQLVISIRSAWHFMANKFCKISTNRVLRPDGLLLTPGSRCPHPLGSFKFTANHSAEFIKATVSHSLIAP
jgi:hypothetical protein